MECVTVILWVGFMYEITTKKRNRIWISDRVECAYQWVREVRKGGRDNFLENIFLSKNKS